MPLPAGTPLPRAVKDLLAARGMDAANALLLVVKEDCGACRDLLPLLDAAVDAGLGPRAPVLVVAEEDEETTAALRAELAPTVDAVADAEPHALSRAMETVFTPTAWRIRDGAVVDTWEGFDPEGLARVLRDLSRALGLPPFELFAPGEAVPAFRPG